MNQDESLHTEDDFFENAPCGCAILHLDGTVQRANAAFLTLLGRPREATFALKIHQVLSRAGAIYYDTQFEPALRLRGSLKEVAFDVVRPTGERVPVLASANIHCNHNGEPTAIRLTVFEASERRLYENELLQSRNRAERMAEVVQNTTDAVVGLAPDGTIQSWNNGAEKMFGFGHNEVTGRDLAEVILAEKRHDDIRGVMELLQRGENVTRDTIGQHKSGRSIDLSLNLTPHMEAPGTLVAFSAIMRDISSRKLTEKALLQSEKLASVGRLASSIAHEINNPLESITNLLYILDTMATDSDVKGYVNAAQDEVARVSQIATHTLRFHRQSTKQTSLNVEDLFQSTLVLYRARLLNAKIVPTIDRSDGAPLFCFEGELRQVMANLVGNAFDAMRTGGRLRLRSRRATLWKSGERGLRLTIADTGTGMTTETLDRLFEPFFSTKGIGGTGLGLWITQGLVEKNRGTICVRSSVRSGTTGTVFCLSFAQHVVQEGTT